jgi:hypothetical protein
LSPLLGGDRLVRPFTSHVKNGRGGIGYVYLTIRFGSLLHPRHVSGEFWAATSAMSRMFARSARFREVFTGLAAASGECAACSPPATVTQREHQVCDGHGSLHSGPKAVIF